MARDARRPAAEPTPEIEPEETEDDGPGFVIPAGVRVILPVPLGYVATANGPRPKVEPKRGEPEKKIRR